MSVTFQKSDIKKAIEKSGGIISTIAKRLKCDWHTADKYIKENNLMAEVQAEKESMLDLAESMLIKNITEQDPASIFFYLKTQGKKRGYVERQEIQAEVTAVTLSPEERDARIAALRAKMDE